MISLDGANFNKKGTNYPYLQDSFLGIDLFKRALDEGVSTSSKLVDEFEENIARFLNVDKDNILAVNSGTSALHLGLIAAGVNPGDKVLLPVLTYVATINAIKYIGAEPVFCDVDKDSWLIKIENKDLFRGCKYIIPVDLYGSSCEQNYEDSGFKTIYDSAESFGFINYSDFEFDQDSDQITCFSFNGNKIMTTGAGGLIIASKKNIDKIKHLSIQGRKNKFNGLYEDIGYNYRMAGINAMLGISQLASMPYFIERKKKINEIYRNELSDILIFQVIDSHSNYWMTTVLFPEDMCIPEIMYYLLYENIPTKRIFRPLNHSKCFDDGNKYPNAEMIYNRGLCLPSSTLCTDEDIMYVCKTIKRLF